ncbi:hypothetical protein FOA52_000133 [Chlamydomonas sp. UWO 241]|nr:hypothetical protein FOA52_000133 [Chlamydomonas sp. UWO 241]
MAEASFKPSGVKDVPSDAFIKAYSAHLKSNDKIHLPTWVDVIKTGAFKELPPQNVDWYFVRAAALCRRLYIRPGMGLGHFQHAFGGRERRRGCKPEHHALAATGNIRHILRNLEAVGLIEKCPTGGRKLTPSGQRDMDLIAGRVPVVLSVC